MAVCNSDLSHNYRLLKQAPYEDIENLSKSLGAPY
jgi:hypothetical protein